jgi:transcription termination/antitermination protein NusG
MTAPSAKIDTAKWYVVHVYAGLETKVAQAIKDRAVEKNMAHTIHDIVIPSEEATEVRRGQKISVERTSRATFW